MDQRSLWLGGWGSSTGLKQGARQSKKASQHMRSAAHCLKAVSAFGKLLRVEASDNVQAMLKEVLRHHISKSPVSSLEEVLGSQPGLCIADLGETFWKNATF